MSAITIESLGLTKEDLTERIVSAAVNSLLHSSKIYANEDGEEVHWGEQSAFSQEMQKRIQAKVDEAIEQIAGKNVLPNVSAYVEGLCLQETNKWGEKVGQPVTFTEYLVQRAEAYLQEPVNYEGKSQSEAGGYGWSKSQTRITHLVHKHLHYTIDSAMKAAVSDLNKKITAGIEGTIRAKLAELQDSLKVEIKTKR